MAHTFTHLLTHVVFSTKERRPLLDAVMRPRLFAYMAGIIREWGGHAIIINGPADHVHILAAIPAKHALSELLRELKSCSTGWIKENFPSNGGFAWQIGYGAFSVSESNADAVREYIATQEEHHKRQTFQEEFVAFLKRHNLKFEERYLWE